MTLLRALRNILAERKAIGFATRGLDLERRGDPDAAIAAFRQGVAAAPGFAHVHCQLGRALADAGREDEAIAALEQALVLEPHHIEAMTVRGRVLFQLGRFKEALAGDLPLSERVPDDFDVHFRVGRSLQETGDMEKAAEGYRTALSIRPDDVDANVGLATVLRSTGQNFAAIPHLLRAADGAPGNDAVVKQLADGLAGVAVTSANAPVAKALVALLANDRIDHQLLLPTVISVLKTSPGYRLVQDGVESRSDVVTLPPADLAGLFRDPLLRAALPKAIFAEPEAEQVVAALRKYILMRADPASWTIESEVPLGLVCALASQCFLTGYAMFVEDAARDRVRLLQAQLEASIEGASEASLAMFAMYAPLGSLSGSAMLQKRTCTADFHPLVVAQIEDPLRERQLAAGLPLLTPIDDNVSIAVREQYEESPYPRWISVGDPAPLAFDRLFAYLHGQASSHALPPDPSILIAGCGTGHHPILVARQFPKAPILAIDLSLASLGYAKRMADKLGITNITFQQADILSLRGVEQRFGMIQCCGVLHHLRDPMKGWRILSHLLEPWGIMRVALYSRHARSAVNLARAHAYAEKIAADAENMRQFRHAVMTTSPSDPLRGLTSFSDFYSLNGFRDLVLHVQEHQFTLPAIGDCLQELGLRMLLLETSDATREQFETMFPGRDAKNHIAAWDQFEQAHPGTFASMYSFWCSRA